jgi:hypothetical protein
MHSRAVTLIIPVPFACLVELHRAPPKPQPITKPYGITLTGQERPFPYANTMAYVEALTIVCAIRIRRSCAVEFRRGRSCGGSASAGLGERALRPSVCVQRTSGARGLRRRRHLAPHDAKTRFARLNALRRLHGRSSHQISTFL